jgi:acetyl-CoA acetyltransferase
VTGQAIRDRTAIVGIGWTPFTRGSGTSTLNLALKASINAAEDAGVPVQDIDGVITHYFAQYDAVAATDVVRGLGLRQCHFEVNNAIGGGWSCGPALLAAQLVHCGVCKYVLVYAANNRYSERTAFQARPVEAARGNEQFTAPFGSHHAAATYGPRATAHMARYGTTSLDFAHLAVTQRRHAMLNTKALMRSPMTIEDHQSSRWVVYPFRLLDCCQQNDGAVAYLITSAERARDLRHRPVHIMAGTGGTGPTAGLWETNGAAAAPRLYEGAGISAKDVSFAELYDPFTFMCMTHMEDFGLVPKGESGAWVREGRNGLDGSCPVNTHGGLLSEAHFSGQNHVIEAVQQLREGGVIDDLCEGSHTYDRRTCRQVRDPQIALLCGETGQTSMLLRRP